jgi:hypothetical protein
MATHIYEVTLVGRFNGSVEIVNRWNYRGDVNAVAGGDAAALVKAMGLDGSGGNFPVGKIGNSIQAITSTLVVWSQVLSRNVYDPTDFIDLPLNPAVAGTAAGESLSPINAYGLRSNRTRLDIGRGYKRFVGVVESAVATGGTIESAALTALNAIADLMGDIITFTDGSLTDSFTPVVVKKLKYTTPSGKTAYKYYPTEAEQLTKLAVGVTWESYLQVRSQVSRQYGRGA